MECERSLVAALRSCSKLAAGRDGKKNAMVYLERGMAIHSQISSAASSLDSILVQNALLDMYVKCGSVIDAARTFFAAKTRDVVSWNILILAYARNGDGKSSLEIFVAMINQGYDPDARTYVAALKACVALANGEESTEISRDFSSSRTSSIARMKISSLEKGMAVHSHVLKTRFLCESYVLCSLIDMYAKCGDMKGGEMIFAGNEKLLFPNVVAWNSMFQGYVDNQMYDPALEMFETMKNSRCCSPDARSFVSLLKACSKLAHAEEVNGFSQRIKARALEKGMALHSLARQAQFERDPFVEASLIDLYSSCGVMNDARRWFDAISQHSVVSWTALVNGYADNEQWNLALELFSVMVSSGFRSNSYTLVAAAKACSGLAMIETLDGAGSVVKVRALEKTMAVHSLAAVESSGSFGIYLASSLIDAYAKCGYMEMAQWIFDRAKLSSVFVWNSLINGYAELGSGGSKRALEFFELFMRCKACFPDSWTFAAAAKAVTAQAIDEKLDKLSRVKIKSLELAMAIHSLAGKNCDDGHVASNLVEAYAKCGSMDDAKRVFDRSKARHPALWIGLISGYCDNDQGRTAVEMIDLMSSQGCMMKNSWTFVAALNASKNAGDLRGGRVFHAEICCCGFENDPSIATQLVDIYAKCGAVDQAANIFAATKKTKLSTWTALIAGYGIDGNSRLVFDLFHQMLDEGFHPDPVTFLSILTACSHGGLVDEGEKIFKAMSSRFGIVPSVEHYHCLADLLCRSNKAAQAVELLQTMPYRGDAVTWILVLEACKKWKNLDLARRAFLELLRFEDNAGNYLTLLTT